MRLRLWLRLWWWSRERAIASLQRDRARQHEDALLAWRLDARLMGELGSPAWNTRGLADDLALHDAADSELGRHA